MAEMSTHHFTGVKISVDFQLTVRGRSFLLDFQHSHGMLSVSAPTTARTHCALARQGGCAGQDTACLGVQLLATEVKSPAKILWWRCRVMMTNTAER